MCVNRVGRREEIPPTVLLVPLHTNFSSPHSHLVIVTSTLQDKPSSMLKVTLVVPLLRFALSLKVTLPSSPVIKLAGMTEIIFFPDVSTLAVTFLPFTAQLPSPVTLTVTDDRFNFLMVREFLKAVISLAVHSDGVGVGVGDKSGVGNEPGVGDVSGVGDEPAVGNVSGVGDESGVGNASGVGDESGVGDKSGVGDGVVSVVLIVPD